MDVFMSGFNDLGIDAHEYDEFGWCSKWKWRNCKKLCAVCSKDNLQERDIHIKHPMILSQFLISFTRLCVDLSMLKHQADADIF